MPLPTPNEGESEDNFISRCMDNPTAIEDFPDTDQRLAVCFDQYRGDVTRKIDMHDLVYFSIINNLTDL